MRAFLNRLSFLMPWRRRAAERDMREELQAIASMAEPRELGNLAMAAEDVRAEWGWTRIELLLRDVRLGFRSLRKNPSFTAIALLSLALGIGANTALFSLWRGVLFAPLPGVADPGALAILTDPDSSGSWTGRWNERTDGPRAWVTYSEFEDLRDRLSDLVDIMAVQSSPVTWRVRFDGGEEEASGRLVSGEFFRVLGADAAIGRVLTADDNRGGAPIAVISDSYWRRRFGGTTAVLGKTLTIENTAITIVGVTKPEFVGETSGMRPDLWMPIRLQPSVLPGRDRLHDTPPEKSMWLHAFARLKPGITISRLDAEANAVFQRGLESFYGAALTADRRAEFLDQHLHARSAARGASRVRSDFSLSLGALFAGVGVLLLIACANLANLLLARGAARRAEIALRLSLGASRWRVVRQLLAESLAVAVLGAAAAIVVANVIFSALVRMMAASDPRFFMEFSLDRMALAFLAGATVVATLLFGAMPAWQVTRHDASANLKDQTRAATASRRQLRSGRLLVGAQLALSLPLLCGAGLFAQTFRNLQHADLGFAANDLLLARVELRELSSDVSRLITVRRALLSELRQVPGVTAVSFSQLGIFTGVNSTNTIVVDGYTPQGDTDRDSQTDMVGPGYFSTIGAPIRMGRDIEEGDREGAPRVCVINQAFARRFFDGRNPIGLHITTVEDDGRRVAYEVVGVAGDMHNFGLREPVTPRYFTAANQPPTPGTSPTFLMRTAPGVAPPIDAVRAAIRRVDPSLPIMSVRTFSQQVAPLTAQDRVTAQLAICFGVVALALAAVGLYGVLSYGVARRRGEIAIRIALGALPRAVVTMILKDTGRVLGVGVALGGVLSYVAAKLIAGRLYGITPEDPVTLVSATLLLAAVAVTAAFLPARRASKVEPVSALRG